LVEYIKEDRTIVEAFDGYWGAPPSIKRVVYRYLPDHNTRVLALESGEVDLALSIPPADVARLKKDPKYKVYEKPCAGLYYMSFNCRNGVFSDSRARLAVNLLIDRDALVNHALDGIGIPAREFFTPAFEWAPKDAPSYTLNTEKAENLFKQAGLNKEKGRWQKNGQPVKISLISYSSRTEMSLLAEAIAGMLQNHGFIVDVNLYTWGGMLDLVKKGDYDANIVFWTPELIGHPDLHLRAHLHSATNLDYSGFKNKNLDMLLEKGREIDYGPEARKTYSEALKIIHDESPIAPLVHKVYVATSTTHLDDYKIHPSGFFFNIKNCSLK
jgi:peptide/nickel transport system substrate-binding protein